jgi:hypothetical protein
LSSLLRVLWEGISEALDKGNDRLLESPVSLLWRMTGADCGAASGS